MKRTTLLLIFVFFLLALGCSGSKSEQVPVSKPQSNAAQPMQLIAGGVYTVESGEGDYGVVKILVLDDETVHARIYRNTYPTRPASIDPKELSLGKLGDSGGFGIGHAPIPRDTFLAWKPVLVSKSEVLKDELEGYEIWKESGDKQ